MATNGVISFKTKEGITTITLGCDGHNAVKLVLEGLSCGQLKENNIIEFIRHDQVGCDECLRISEHKISQERFTNSRWKYTAPDTLTVNFAKRVIELSDSSQFAFSLANKEKSILEIRAGLLKNGWRIMSINLPRLNKQAEKNADQIGACWN